MSSIIPIIVGQKIIREASRSRALLDDDEYCKEMQDAKGDESADDLFGAGLFGGFCAVMCACITVKCGGWFLWGAAAVFSLVSGSMFFASYRLLRMKMNITPRAAALSVSAPVV